MDLHRAKSRNKPRRPPVKIKTQRQRDFPERIPRAPPLPKDSGGCISNPRPPQNTQKWKMPVTSSSNPKWIQKWTKIIPKNFGTLPKHSWIDSGKFASLHNSNMLLAHAGICQGFSLTARHKTKQTITSRRFPAKKNVSRILDSRMNCVVSMSESAQKIAHATQK